VPIDASVDVTDARKRSCGLGQGMVPGLHRSTRHGVNTSELDRCRLPYSAKGQCIGFGRDNRLAVAAGNIDDLEGDLRGEDFAVAPVLDRGGFA
jgi:hypothetical protein